MLLRSMLKVQEVLCICKGDMLNTLFKAKKKKKKKSKGSKANYKSLAQKIRHEACNKINNNDNKLKGVTGIT